MDDKDLQAIAHLALIEASEHSQFIILSKIDNTAIIVGCGKEQYLISRSTVIIDKHGNYIEEQKADDEILSPIGWAKDFYVFKSAADAIDTILKELGIDAFTALSNAFSFQTKSNFCLRDRQTKDAEGNPIGFVRIYPARTEEGKGISLTRDIRRVRLGGFYDTLTPVGWVCYDKSFGIPEPISGCVVHPIAGITFRKSYYYFQSASDAARAWAEHYNDDE